MKFSSIPLGKKFAAFMIVLMVLIGGLDVVALTHATSSLYEVFSTAVIGAFFVFSSGNVWSKFSPKGKILAGLMPTPSAQEKQLEPTKNPEK